MSLTMTNPAIILPTKSIGTLLPTSPSNNQQKSPSSSTMSFVTSSPEIFSKICEYLTPIDIFKLSRVCKQYRNFLCTPSSTTYQNIWRTSRMKFLTYPQLPPPQGMDEKNYIKILIYDKSCEFCGNSDPGSSRLYWEFRVRCCDKCLLKRTKTHEDLEKSAGIPVDVIDTLPCVWIRGGAFAVPVHRYYWIDNIKSTTKEYSLLKGKDRKNWLLKKKEQHKKYMAEVSQYYFEDQKQWNEMYKKQRNC
ncbi:hypothetical protein RhiirA4_398017 [Rhizophagus irregularis]|uniref:F-box domain-containing protein n=1 Tax=Rhizophagus irregularis TaxID=588596 RepID=A0A2I1G8B6_9GLOM|nr:hypothetical protein RhiirA4_398017 [Rhizophagus irregularis]